MAQRKLTVLALGLVVMACASTPDPPPPPPPTPKPAPPPPPPPPPPPRVAVANVRAVETGRVPRDLLETLTRKLQGELLRPGVVLLTGTATTASDPSCFMEACQLAATRGMGADTLFHTRIVQYAEHCVVLATQYDAHTGRSLWGHAESTLCEAEPLTAAISALAQAFDQRPDAALGPTHAVLPVQHDIEDIKFASESYGEVLSTLLTAARRTVIAASGLVMGPDGAKIEPKKACADKKCAYELGAAAQVDKAITAKITKKGKACTIAAALHDVATKTSSITATAKVGCDPHELADALRGVSQQLVGR